MEILDRQKLLDEIEGSLSHVRAPLRAALPEIFADADDRLYLSWPEG